MLFFGKKNTKKSIYNKGVKKNMNIETILNNLEMKKTYLKKSNKTSGDTYLVTIKNKRNNKKISFHFHDNYLNESNLKDILYCLKLDAESYYYSSDFKNFCDEFGYSEDSIKALKIYNYCKKQYERYNKLFNEEEKEYLNIILEDY